MAHMTASSQKNHFSLPDAVPRKGLTPSAALTSVSFMLAMKNIHRWPATVSPESQEPVERPHAGQATP